MENYDEVNQLLKDLAGDLDMPVETFKRVYFAPPEERRLYIGSGEDFSPHMLINENSAYGAFLRGETR